MSATLPSPEISIVLSTLGNYEMLRRVLDAYERQTVGPDSFELLVVSDRGDPDPAAVQAAIGSRPYRVTHLRGEVRGLSANRNVGWRAAAAPIVLFTDNDTLPVPRFLEEHLSTHAEHDAEHVAVVGHVRWARELRRTPLHQWLDEGVQFDYGSIRGTEASWAHLYGANSSIKRGFIARVGGYDEERLPYLYEDLDFGYRARAYGLRVIYNREAVVDHVRPGMTLDFWKQKMRRMAAAERQFVTIHPDATPWLYERFRQAEQPDRIRGRSVKLARFIPEWIPWLGPRVWRSARLTFTQELAPYFLSGWEEAEDSPASAAWLAASADGGR